MTFFLLNLNFFFLEFGTSNRHPTLKYLFVVLCPRTCKKIFNCFLWKDTCSVSKLRHGRGLSQLVLFRRSGNVAELVEFVYECQVLSIFVVADAYESFQRKRGLKKRKNPIKSGMSA